MCCQNPFGGINVLIVGDPAQLTYVVDNALWKECTRQNYSTNGILLYRIFDTVV